MNKIKKKFEIVVARYNENIEWLNSYKEITIIYNKGLPLKTNMQCIQLPNYGRESHTYLYHIIQNYDKLKEYTIFFQGAIQDHKPLRIEEYFQENDFNGYLRNYPIEQIQKPLHHFGKWKNEYQNGSIKKSPITCYEWLTDLIQFDKEYKEIPTVWGAIFSVSRNIILKKPKIFYEHLLRFIDYHSNPEEGHFFERSWYTIFHTPHIEKKIINVSSNNINQLDDVNHIWVSIHNALDLLNEKKASQIVFFPNYFFPIFTNSFSSSQSQIQFKAVVNDDSYFLWNISNNQFQIYLNQKIIFHGSIKNNQKKNKFKIQYNSLFEFYLNEKKIFHYHFSTDNNVFYFVKTSNYNTIIQFDYKNKYTYFVKQNEYFNIKHYYTNHYLDSFIEFI